MAVPEVVKKRPPILAANLFWWNAYHELTAERLPSGIVPPSAVREYAILYGVPPVTLCRIIDRMELARLGAKRGTVRH